MQAWNGGGTGAWYRVDTSCLYSFLSTTSIHCLPMISIPANVTSITDGYFVSLGIFNRFNGVGFDIGLTFDPRTNIWWSYANDARGWKSGSISIDSSVNRCINMSLSISDGIIKYTIRTGNGSIVLGHDLYQTSQIDPLLNLTMNTTNFGFYRFDSIAQTIETLTSGSHMIHAQLNEWLLELTSGDIIRASGNFIASNTRGFHPGPCCTPNEINTIHVYNEVQWTEADISIIYN